MTLDLIFITACCGVAGYMLLRLGVCGSHFILGLVLMGVSAGMMALFINSRFVALRDWHRTRNTRKMQRWMRSLSKHDY